MAQYNRQNQTFLENNTTLYETVMIGDPNGNVGPGSGRGGHSRYSLDAWGRPKAVMDHSLFSATFTFNVPNRVWEQVDIDNTPGYNPVQKPIDNTYIRSSDRMLSVLSGTSAGAGHVVKTKNFVRYQPNRGQLFSTAIILPNPTASGIREFGLGTAHNGVEFQLIGDGADWDLRFTRRKGTVVQTDVSLKPFLPADFDPSKGHVYDIQFQWRGVGNYYVFVDLELVYTDELTGTLESLSINDPALPVYFDAICTEEGTEVELLCGCVDVASEGGEEESTLFNSINSGNDLVALGNADVDTAVLAIKVPRTLTYNSETVFNSRGAIMDKLAVFCASADTMTKVYVARDYAAPTVDALTWNSIPDSRMLQLNGDAAGALNTAFQTDKAGFSQILATFSAKDSKTYVTNDSKTSDFIITPGDILIISGTGLQSTSQLYAATLYFSEQL